jgi:hypothetical protein
MKTPLLILSLLSLTSFTPFSYEVELTGHLRKRAATSNIQNVEVFVKGDGRLLGRANTDKKGNFKLFFLDNREKEFSFYAVVSKADTVFLKSISKFATQQPEITFYLPYNSTKR